MALNLWKIGGQPTSYNPLPSGFNNKISTMINSYVLTIKAKSSSNAVLRVAAGNGTNLKIDGLGFLEYSLNAEPKTYVHSIVGNVADLLFIVDKNSVGDIIIEDIQLVQKPLPKLTINGISGEVGDWEQGSGNGLWVNDGSLLRIKSKLKQVTSSSQQTFSFSSGFQMFIREFENKSSGEAELKTHTWVNSPYSFTPLPATKALGIVFKKSDDSTITPFEITNIKPMLNLGTTPAPYEPKRGERMVLSSVKGRNLLSNIDIFYNTLKQPFEVVTINSIKYAKTNVTFNSDFRQKGLPVNCKPNTQYTMSFIGYQLEGNPRFTFNYSDGTSESVYNNSYPYESARLVGVSSPNKTLIAIGATYSTVTNQMLVAFDSMVLNEGSTPLPYEPYTIQLNKKPKRWVPKKNLFDKNAVTLNQYLNLNGTLSSSGVGNSTSGYVPIKPSTDYKLSGFKLNTDYGFYVVYFDSNKNVISYFTYNSTFDFVQFNKTPSNAFYVRFSFGKSMIDTIQLEEGTTATQYEPYQLVLPRAKRNIQSKPNKQSKR